MLSALTLFAQEYTYYTQDGRVPTDGTNISAPLLILFISVSVIIGVVCLASLWRIFEKAGQPGWAAIVPVYNVITLLRVVGRPIWWVVFYLLAAIPIAGYIVAFIASAIVDNDLAKSFRKDAGFTALLIFLPFIALPMLALGDATYETPKARATAT